MITWSAPYAAIGLIALPLLVAIYWLRRKPSKQVVPALFLWQGNLHRQPGGGKVKPQRLPWIFALELLTLTCLILAAIGPLISRKSAKPNLILILDGSFSMTAGEPSPRTLFLENVETDLKPQSFESIEIVVAGIRPEFIGRCENGQGLKDLLDLWSAQQPQADIEEAITWVQERHASDLQLPKVVVVSDHKTKNTNADITWLCYGNKQLNRAFVRASRRRWGNQERIGLAIANFSNEPFVLELNCTHPQILASLKKDTILPGSTKELRFTIPYMNETIGFTLPDDAVTLDNHINLLPESARRISVSVNLDDSITDLLIRRALKATGRVVFEPVHPNFRIANKPDDGVDLVIQKPASPVSFLGPFIVDHSHPISAGLSLTGAIWGASTLHLPGQALISAGDIPLLSIDLQNQLWMNFEPSASTLQSFPDWPILIQNIVDWCIAARPGVPRVNHSLGTPITIMNPHGWPTLELTSREGARQEITLSPEQASLEITEPGVYQLKHKDFEQLISINCLALEESDLRDLTTIREELLITAKASTNIPFNATLILALMGLMLFFGHAYLTSGTRRLP